MVNGISTVSNKTKAYDGVSNPFTPSSSVYSSNFDMSLFLDDSLENNLNLPFLNPCQMNFINDLMLFDLFLKNQMPPFMMNTFFTNNYNTKTDLKALKDVYNPDLANKLANIAEKNAYKTNTVGWCARGTNDALEMAGLSKGETRVASAYQAEDKLRNHKNFREVAVSREDLAKLPAGCVIVWQASPGRPHGHIAVTLGDGREASDHVQSLRTDRPAAYSVFVPVGNKKTDLKA